MKKIKGIFTCWVFVTFSMCACCSCESQTINNKSLATEWINILNAHDTTGLSRLYSDSAKLASPNWEGFIAGRDAVKQTYSRYFSSTPDLQHSINNILSTDSAVIIEYTFYGTLLNPEHNTPEYMRGKKYSLNACTVMSIRNRKITKQQTYFDQVSFLKQVGFFDQR
jgi:steroid delta-isomerase-like uncharacterized protein